MSEKSPAKVATENLKKEPASKGEGSGRGAAPNKQGQEGSQRHERGPHERGEFKGRERGGGHGGRRGGGNPRFNRNMGDRNMNQQRGDGGHNQYEGPSRDGGYRPPRNPPDYSNLEDVIPKEPKKFTGRCRLFVGNITPDTTEEEFKELFSKYGEISEIFVNGSKGFGFIRLDYRHNAEAAKVALDGTQRKGRVLRVRFANHGAAVKLKNLSPFVSNELLHQAFTQFGDVERAIVYVDERGRSLGEGLVEFSRKPGATQAMKRIGDGVFLMSAYPRPVICEPLEPKDEEDGLPEKFLPRNDQVRKDREKDPRFAPPGSFEYRFAQRWKELDDLEKQQHDRVKKEMEDARMKLESEMEGAMYEFQADQIRQDLMRQQEELQRLEEMRQEQMIRRQELDMRRQEESRMLREEEERRREMIMHGGNENSMRGGRGVGGMESGMDRGRMERGGQLEQQGSMREPQRGRPGGHPPVPPPPAPPAAMIESMQNEEMSSGFGSMGGGNGGMSNPSQMGGGGQGMGGAQSGQMRQSRFDNQGGSFGGSNGNFGGRGTGMGGQGTGMQGQSRQAAMQGQGGMFASGMGGGMGGNRAAGANLNDRRRDGGPRDDYGDLKRMRRY